METAAGARSEPARPDRAMSFLSYFRSPAVLTTFGTPGALSTDEGYFEFEGSICYGRCAGTSPSPLPIAPLPRPSSAANPNEPSLPFNLCEIVTNLRQERYRTGFQNQLERLSSSAAARKAYYALRPLMPVSIRKHLQRLRLRGWENIAFPAWPVDLTVEKLMRTAMGHLLRTNRVERIPFIWFWPDAAESCVLMTHDIEGSRGRDFCSQLMDIDDAFGIKSSFQMVPQWLSRESENLILSLRRRGFEVNIHDLNHDGSLFRDRDAFPRRARQINDYARELGCQGFRSGAMYREQSWYGAFDFAYDMSVPNVAHLEPQRGGCCTVMPYFIENVLELPLTTTQDYSLFHILNEYSIELWKRQIELIRSRNGLISFIVHPDYLVEERARDVYVELLALLSRLTSTGNLWLALPAEINRWWRSRAAMNLVACGRSWVIEGPESDRARVAYARLEGDRVVYSLDEQR
jgi:hypothetical protein